MTAADARAAAPVQPWAGRAGPALDVPTPRADAVLRNPLATPAGVAEWLRVNEAELARARAAVDRAVRDTAAVGAPVHVLLARAADDLGRALDDEVHGMLPRLLRRPLRQLVPGSPACASFDRLRTDLVTRAGHAVRLQPLLADAWGRLSALRDAHHAAFPNVLARELQRAGLDEAAVGRMRVVADAEYLLVRLERVGERMAEWRADAREPAATPDVQASDEPFTAEELAALVRRGLRERERLVAASEGTRQLRTRLARHAAARPNAGTVRAAGPAPVVRELLLTAARLAEANALGASDGPLWAWALNGAESDRAAAWETGDLSALAPAEPDASTGPNTRYIVPLGGGDPGGSDHGEGLAWVTADVTSAVRVWDATVRVDQPIRGQISAPATTALDPVAQRDLTLLYEGIELDRSAWYRTAERVVLRVVAHCPGGWVARTERRGVVRPTAAAAWEPNAGSAGSFRILRPASARPHRASAAQVLTLGEAGASFAGAATFEVRTALAGDGRAWWRVPVADTVTAAAALDRELALFEEMARTPSAASAGLVPLGYARRAVAGDPLPLYRRPLATGPGFGELAPAWLADAAARVTLIAAIAGAVVAVHAARAALGLVHPGMFSYGLAYRGRRLAPTAVLAHAPWAAPFGTNHDGAWLKAADAREGLRLPRLRLSAAPLMARRGARASRETDAHAFLLCALDLLALETLPAGAVEATGDAYARVVEHRSHFAAPSLALGIAEQLKAGDPAAWVRMLDRMAAGFEEAGPEYTIDG